MASDNFFSDDYLDRLNPQQQVEQGPVTVFGLTFKNDEERRQYFREELRRRLPELRKIEGFPIGEDDDIINLSDPPYYTACPNPWLNDFIAQWEEEKKQLQFEGKRKSDFEVKEPYAQDISVGKNNEIYNAHSYHTKVPHPAIMRLLYHYTQPGDIVYDGFAGTGMTGVASGFCKDGNSSIVNKGVRHCVCSDLSPIASFISYNLNINRSGAFSKFSQILNNVKEKYSSFYQTKHSNGKYGEIRYVVWSDIIACPQCGEELRFWDTFVKYGEGEILDESYCPHCSSLIIRKSAKKVFNTVYDQYLNKPVSVVKSVPVLINYTYKGKRYTKKPDKEDIDLYKTVSEIKNESWVPTDALIDGDKMGDPKAKGIFHVHQFYNNRTLFLLSKIWEECDMDNWFCVTNSISRNLTKLNRFIVNKYNLCGRINGPLSGTLYPPSEVVEQNVFDLLEERQSNVDSFMFENAVQVGDALSCITMPDNSVDYIFTDPPFGHNIMYSELNYLSEVWLKVKTNNVDEAIENKTQNKSIETYMRLMSKAFNDYYRILKPGKWLTVEFSNPSASIWNAIQTAITNAGFVVVNVCSFDKVHGGQKAMRYTTTVKEDLIITAYKPTDKIKEAVINNSSVLGLWDFVHDHLIHLPVHLETGHKTTSIIERSAKILHDRMVSYYVVNGCNIPINLAEFQQELRNRFVERDEMFFTAKQAAEYEEKKLKAPEFVPMGIIVSDEASGIEWLKNNLRERSKTYQEIQPDWVQAINGLRKGDVLPELRQLLEENFIQNSDETWRIANIEDDVDMEMKRTKVLLKEFKLYLEVCRKPRGKLKDVRVEAVRAGFKQCYSDKNFADIILVGDRIPQNLLTEDEVLLQYYDIASSKV